MSDEVSSFWLMVFYCLLIFAAGSVFGFIFTIDGQVGFLAVLGALASIATVGAAIVAVIALRGWKSQFNFQKKYDSVIHLRTFLYSTAESRAFLTALRDHLASYLRSSDADILSDPDNYPFEFEEKWLSHFSDINRAWDTMNVFLTDEEFREFKFAPDHIAVAVNNAKDKMIEVTFSETKNSILHLHEATNLGVNEISQAYKGLELQTREFLKVISS